MSTAHDGSTSVRNPALVFGAGLITSPRPFTRITVPRTSTVPAARSTASRDRAPLPPPAPPPRSTASHVTPTLAHPQSRRQQHVDKIRQIPFPSLVVAAEPRPQLARLSNTQSARTPLRPARTDSAGISYGVVLKCVMAGSQPGHSGQYCSAQLRQRRAVLIPNRPQMAVNYPRRQLQHPSVAEVRHYLTRDAR